MLTPEQQIIADGWEKEHKARVKLMDEFEAACSAGDMQKSLEIVGKLAEISPTYCEHDRDVYAEDCQDCEDIENELRKMYPERYIEENVIIGGEEE